LSLKKQTLSGLVWTFTDTFVLKGSSFIASLILARILGPQIFGLIGMLSIFIAIGQSLVDSGLSSSIIRTKDADDKDFSTVFYTNLVMSFLIYGIIFFCAPFIAKFYNQQILISIVRLYCLTFIISSFSAIQIAILTKNMQFKKLMLCNIPGTVIGIIIGIVMAYSGYGVWSIVWMYLISQIAQSIMLSISSKWKPSFSFSREKLQFHFHFGYKLMLSGVINTSFNNIYNVIIGKFYPVQTLGFYERAYLFNQYPVTTLTGIISRVTYPLLANIQHENERIAIAYKKLIQITFFITAPLMFGAAAIAEPLFLIVLGKEWMPSVPFFQILCIGSMFLPIHSFNLNVLQVYGRSDLFLKLEIVKKAVIVITIMIAFQFGIYALVWSSVFTGFIALLINTHYSSTVINYTTNKQLRDMLPILILSGIMFILMYLTFHFLLSFPLSVQIILPVIIGAVFYFTVNLLFKIPSFLYLQTLIKERKL
jgi:O-antigen/teichoic acid export membrane protein